MCGITGIIGPNQIYQDFDMFEELLYVSALRGRNSTGTMVTGPRGGPIISKRIGSAWNFLSKEKTDLKSPLRSFGKDVRFGHCREATVGEVNVGNAHPFDTGNFIGMHNGTLADPQYHKKGVTDSELMFREMEVGGIIPTLRDLMPQSAYAVAIYDKRDRSVSLARHGRELAIAVHKRIPMMYFLSEWRMLQAITSRNHEDVSIGIVEPDRLLRIHPEGIKAVDSIEKADFIEVLDIK